MAGLKVLILGATSDLAFPLAEKFIQQGDTVMMAARDAASLRSRLSEKGIKGVIETPPFDARAFDGHKKWFESLPQSPDVTVCLFGYLGEQTKAEHDWTEAQKIIESNYTGAVSILNVVGEAYSNRKHGVIAGFSSVAGERGRQSNYIYGSAKAGFTAYLSGLRNRLFKNGVHVLTVKPGFMYTKMTQGLKLPGALTATPERAASRVISAIKSSKNVVYVLPIWYWIMMVIRNIPEFVFKRLKL
jgi:decaprenylphospho-beta-D-erythro-pentofuranosid-2-ulose 2-reductase